MLPQPIAARCTVSETCGCDSARLTTTYGSGASPYLAVSASAACSALTASTTCNLFSTQISDVIPRHMGFCIQMLQTHSTLTATRSYCLSLNDALRCTGKQRPTATAGSISSNPSNALWYASGSDKIATVLDFVDESMNSAHKLLRPGPYYAGLLYVHHPSSTCGAGCVEGIHLGPGRSLRWALHLQ